MVNIMELQEILIIKNGEITYGIDTSYIDQILHVPSFTKLLFSPASVLGLASVSGKIVTCMDFSRLISGDSSDSSRSDDRENDRILSFVNEYQSSALLVDSVVVTIELDSSKIEKVETTSENDFVVGHYHHNGEIIQIVTLEKLFNNIKLDNVEKRSIIDSSSKEIKVEVLADKERFLLFNMGSEEYAVSLDILREIIVVPDEFTPLAGASSEVKGMISLRDELIIVVDLRSYYGFDIKNSDKNRVLITYREGKKIALIIDEIVDIRDFETKKIDKMPANFQDSKVSGIIHHDRSLISIVGASVLDDILEKNSYFNEEVETSQLNVVEDGREFVLFKLGEEEFALEIDYVSEIIDAMDITKVSDSSDFILGLVNIRGKIVNIGSLYHSLGVEQKEYENRKMIICEHKNMPIGFCVESVTDILNISHNNIHDEKSSDTLFESILHLNNGERIVMLFDLERVLKESA